MRRRWMLLLIAILAACTAVVVAQLPAMAIDVTGGSGAVTGNATWFSGVGAPYGGCGLPESAIDSTNYIALNVQNSPGNYSNLARPISSANASEIGMWDNGLNCGRWVKVTIGNNCTGINDGAPNQPFCRNGSWVSDGFNGATLNMVVADSCDDGNAWCKDDPYHIDMHQVSLNNFLLNGQPVGNMYPGSWNNRQVTWQFENAPNYTGDINIGAIQGSQPYWTAIAISHLPNGIHGVQYLDGGTWTNASMDSDQGNDYIINSTTGAGGASYEIRVIDASGNYVNNGEVYTFGLPSSCSTGCGPAYTAITYTSTSGAGGTPSPSPSSTPTSTPTATPTPTPTPTHTPTPTPSPTATKSGSCALTSSLTSSWSGGYQLQLTVTNSGTTPITGWAADFGFADAAETVANSWNATVTQTGQKIAAGSLSYNGSLAAGASTTFGMTVNGSNSTLSGLTCAAT